MSLCLLKKFFCWKKRRRMVCQIDVLLFISSNYNDDNEKWIANFPILFLCLWVELLLSLLIVLCWWWMLLKTFFFLHHRMNSCRWWWCNLYKNFSLQLSHSIVVFFSVDDYYVSEKNSLFSNRILLFIFFLFPANHIIDWHYIYLYIDVIGNILKH